MAGNWLLGVEGSLGSHSFDKTQAVTGLGAEYALSDSWAIRAGALAATITDDATLNSSQRKFDFANCIIRVDVTHQF